MPVSFEIPFLQHRKNPFHQQQYQVANQMCATVDDSFGICFPIALVWCCVTIMDFELNNGV